MQKGRTGPFLAPALWNTVLWASFELCPPRRAGDHPDNGKCSPGITSPFQTLLQLPGCAVGTPPSWGQRGHVDGVPAGLWVKPLEERREGGVERRSGEQELGRKEKLQVSSWLSIVGGTPRSLRAVNSNRTFKVF